MQEQVSEYLASHQFPPFRWQDITGLYMGGLSELQYKCETYKKV